MRLAHSSEYVSHHFRKTYPRNLQGQNSPLHIACYKGHDKVVQALLKHPRLAINSYNAQDMSALERAVRAGHTRTVKLLLSQPGIGVVQVRRDVLLLSKYFLLIPFHCILTGQFYVV